MKNVRIIISELNLSEAQKLANILTMGGYPNIVEKDNRGRWAVTSEMYNKTDSEASEELKNFLQSNNIDWSVYSSLIIFPID